MFSFYLAKYERVALLKRFECFKKRTHDFFYAYTEVYSTSSRCDEVQKLFTASEIIPLSQYSELFELVYNSSEPCQFIQQKQTRRKIRYYSKTIKITLLSMQGFIEIILLVNAVLCSVIIAHIAILIAFYLRGRLWSLLKDSV